MIADIYSFNWIIYHFIIMPNTQLIRRRPTQLLEALALHHLVVVDDKETRGITDGIDLDCTSGLITLAFIVEGFINLVGQKVLGTAWRERDPYHVKLEKLLKKLEIDSKTEPILTLDILKIIRDDIAHPKPTDLNIECSSEGEARMTMRPDWFVHCEPSQFRSAFEQVDKFKALLIKHAKLKTSTYLSSAQYPNRQT